MPAKIKKIAAERRLLHRSLTFNLREEALHFVKERFFGSGVLVFAKFRKLLVEFLFFARKILWNFYLNINVEATAIAAPLEGWQTLFANAQAATRLSACAELDVD